MKINPPDIDEDGKNSFDKEFEDLEDGDFENRVYEEYDDIEFAEPGGNSALRAATPNNPRICPCPTCKRENILTIKDKELGYQCNFCADKLENGFDY